MSEEADRRQRGQYTAHVQYNWSEWCSNKKCTLGTWIIHYSTKKPTYGLSDKGK